MLNFAYVVSAGPPPPGYERTLSNYYSQSIPVDVCVECGATRGLEHEKGCLSGSISLASRTEAASCAHAEELLKVVEDAAQHWCQQSLIQGCKYPIRIGPCSCIPCRARAALEKIGA